MGWKTKEAVLLETVFRKVDSLSRLAIRCAREFNRENFSLEDIGTADMTEQKRIMILNSRFLVPART